MVASLFFHVTAALAFALAGDGGDHAMRASPLVAVTGFQ